MYEEIGDIKSSFTYTQNVLYGHSTTGTVHTLTSDPVPAVPTSLASSESHNQDAKIHNYELIETTGYQSIDGAYKVQLCSAYGIASLADMSCDSTRSHDTSRPCDKLHNPKKLWVPSGLHFSYALDDSCDADREENENDCGENSARGVTSSESCDLEECPAYGVPPLS